MKIALILAAILASGAAFGQNVTCATRPTSDSSNACASTAFVHSVQGNILNPQQLTVTGVNTLSPLTVAPLNGAALIINGIWYYPPNFSVSGVTITWNYGTAGFSLSPTTPIDDVKAIIY